MAQKKWKKPKLIVLVRHKPDEYVLSACKTHAQGSSSNDYDTNCAKDAGGGACSACYQSGS